MWRRVLFFCVVLLSAVFLSGPSFGQSPKTTLSVNSGPGTKVYLDGKYAGKTPLAEFRVVPGRHRVRYQNEEQGTQFEFDLAVKPGVHMICSYTVETGDSRCAAESPPATPAKTRVTLKSTPDADAFLDGRLIGRTPVEGLIVDAGPHRVEFRHPEYETIVQEVQVSEGEHVKVNVVFPVSPPGGSEEPPQSSP
jgi:hypothetical protein